MQLVFMWTLMGLEERLELPYLIQILSKVKQITVLSGRPHRGYTQHTRHTHASSVRHTRLRITRFEFSLVLRLNFVTDNS